MSDTARRKRVQQIAGLADEVILVDDAIGERALLLQSLGFAPADALHIACAEKGNADLLLTTDYSFARRAVR